MPTDIAAVPETGNILIVGSTNSGKTTLTANAIDRWIAHHDPCGMAAIDFAPEIEHDGQLIGGRLDRVTDIPAGAWYGVLEALGPRALGSSVEDAVRLALRNVIGAQALISMAPNARAVFVNDASIMFGHPTARPQLLLAYCEGAEVALINSYFGDELASPTHPVSQAEAHYLADLHTWADHVIRLGTG